MNLEECRKKINLLDDQICDLFVERMKVSSEVAKAKMAAKKIRYRQFPGAGRTAAHDQACR